MALKGKSRSYRLTSAHPSTPLRAGSFEKRRKVRQPRLFSCGRECERWTSAQIKILVEQGKTDQAQSFLKGSRTCNTSTNESMRNRGL